MFIFERWRKGPCMYDKQRVRKKRLLKILKKKKKFISFIKKGSGNDKEILKLPIKKFESRYSHPLSKDKATSSFPINQHLGRRSWSAQFGSIMYARRLPRTLMEL